MKVNVWKRCEIVLHSDKTYANPFADVDIDAVFTNSDGTTIALPGFWNGGDEWKVRFSPNKAGVWKYTVTCTDKDNASLCASGEIEAVKGEPTTDLEKHGFVRLEPGKRYFVYDDGTPFFYLADTHWQMPDLEHLDDCNYPGCNCGSQFKHVVNDRLKKGFNVYQTYFDSAESDGGGNIRTRHWWTEKYSIINPAAFNESMDIMMEYLADKGFTVALGFGVHCSTTAGFGYKVEPLLKFSRYCVARYACYPVVWITGQEITNLTGSTFDMWKQVGALVAEIDGYHRPNGAHMHSHGADAFQSHEVDKQPWHQWWTLQAGHGESFQKLRPRFFYRDFRNYPSNKLYIETECFYEDLGLGNGGTCGSDTTRQGAWNAVLAGSAGFTYGVVGIWALRYDKQPRGWSGGYNTEPWYIGVDKHGSTEMTYLKRFFDYVHWETLEPCFGYADGMFECRRTVAIARRNKDTFIYYFDDEDYETGCACGLLPNVEYTVRWYDPIHGFFVKLPSITTPDGSYDMPRRPSKRDWALLITREDLGEAETVDKYPEYISTIPPWMAKHGDEIEIKKIWATDEAEGHPATAMIDGSDETFWQTDCPVNAKTVYIDLGESQEVGWLQIKSLMKDGYFIRYRVYGSNDGENYELISERPIDGAVGVGGSYTDFYDAISGKYRYLQLFIHSAYRNAPNLEIHKLGVYKK